MRSAERWLERLQLSDSSQRQLKEAVLDWQHEASAATTTRARMIAHLRSSVGLARLGVVVAWRDVAELAISPWGWVFVGWFIVLTWFQFHQVTPTPTLPQTFADVENVSRLVGSMAWALSLAGFLTMSLGPSDRRAPLIGLLAMALFASVATNCVLRPIAWQNIIAVEQGPTRSFQAWSQMLAVPLIAAAGIGVLTGDAIRRDKRRWTSLLLAALAYVMVWSLPTPVSVALFLNDLHLVGDTVYLPVIPKWFSELRYTAWPLPIAGAMVAIALWWRQSREVVGRNVSA